jgi:hypothetical protein
MMSRKTAMSKHLPWLEGESINCIRYLKRAYSALNKSAPKIRTSFENYHSAFAVVSLEMFKDPSMEVEKAGSLHNILRVFLPPIHWKTAEPVLNQIKSLLLYFYQENKIQDWRDFQKWSDNLLNVIFTRCFGALNGKDLSALPTDDKQNIANCLSHLLCIWNTIAFIYLGELKNATKLPFPQILASNPTIINEYVLIYFLFLERFEKFIYNEIMNYKNVITALQHRYHLADHGKICKAIFDDASQKMLIYKDNDSIRAFFSDIVAIKDLHDDTAAEDN